MTNSIETTENFLIELEVSLLQSSVRNSDAVSRLLAEDFTEFGSSGKIFSKSQVLTALQGEPFVKFNASQFKTQLLS